MSSQSPSVHVSSLSAYSSAFGAASVLADSLENSPAIVEHATRELLRAVDQTPLIAGHEAGQEFAPGRTTEAGAEVITLEKALILAAADAELARVLLAASEAVGEKGPPTSTALLRSELETARLELQSLTQAETAVRMGFAAAAHASSPDLATAVASFKADAEATLNTIIAETDALVTKALEKLGDQQEHLVSAFKQVSNLFEAAAAGTDLLRRALKKLLSSLRTFYDFAMRLSSVELESYFKTLSDAVKTKTALEYFFDSSAARTEITSLTLAAPLAPATVDKASEEMRVLGARFKTLAGHAQKIAAVIGVAAAILAAKFTAIGGPLAIPATYGVMIVGLILMGRDYMDSGTMFTTVRGVREIARGLRAARTEADVLP